MKQFAQKLDNGEMRVLEVPVPFLSQSHVLVKNHFSVISAGTEGSRAKAARKCYLGKAKERPQQLKQVLDAIKKQGIAQTYRAVMRKLDVFAPAGYSCAGEVIDASSDVNFRIGDFVACAGATACHAEVISVPANLCVRLNPDTDLKSAAYNALGAIAMQGVRQADLRLGEICAVIGLGLIGQITALLLRASGIRVVGIDIDQTKIELASRHCADLAIIRNSPGLEGEVDEFTEGHGCDAVIIAAESKSLDPINLAGAIARKKGKVVVVGAVPTGFDRDPHYYGKELSVSMSCSYGPGRYDPDYEQKGMDYPYAYVRWTERRNMKAFQDLIHKKRIDPSYLTTHVFKLADVPAAYDMIVNKSEPFIGILIEYDTEKTARSGLVPVTKKAKLGAVNIGFIGAGSYAQKALIPNIPKDIRVVLKGVMTSSSSSSYTVAECFGFEFCTAQEKDILDHKEINTVFIATRHDTHSCYVKRALASGKHVFVEKPLCTTLEELTEIQNFNSSSYLHVGFNRRFSSLSQLVKQRRGHGPVSMIYRINAGYISKDSWIQDRAQGGRIVGEVCHFIDYLTFINGSLPSGIYACTMRDRENLNDTLSINIDYENGSIGTISYFANGSEKLAKEYIEIYDNGIVAVIDDFKEVRVYESGKVYKKRLTNQDKGQRNQVQHFVNAILTGGDPPIPANEIYNSTLVTLKVSESLRTGERIIL